MPSTTVVAPAIGRSVRFQEVNPGCVSNGPKFGVVALLRVESISTLMLTADAVSGLLPQNMPSANARQMTNPRDLTRFQQRAIMPHAKARLDGSGTAAMRSKDPAPWAMSYAILNSAKSL